MKRQSSSSPGTFLGKQNIQAKEVYYLPYLGVRFPQPVSSKKYSFLITFNSTPCSPPPPAPPQKLPKYCFFCFHFPEEIRSTMLRVFNFFSGWGRNGIICFMGNLKVAKVFFNHNLISRVPKLFWKQGCV